MTRTCLAAVIALLLCPLALAAPAGARETGTPTNGTPPSVSGNAIEGGKLKAARGSWSGGTPLRYSVAWSRCTAAGTECKPISGAIKAGYKAVLADVGHRLTATIKATNKEGAGEATSAPSAVIAPAPPKKRKVATISGEAVDGRVLTVGEGTWKGTTPFSFTYQWMRCNGRSCEAIAGATEKSYRAQSADIGRKLRAIVTAHNGAGPASARSKPSAKVAPGSPLNLAPPTIEGTVLPGQTLTAHNGTWVGTPPIAYTYQWLSCSSLGGGCTEIVGATEQTYQVKAEQIGDAFEVVVTATNAEGKASATSAETSITGGGVSAPEDLLPPTVLGLPITGQELTATEGTWKGTEPSYAFQWEVCNASGGACEEIVGATTSKYTIPNGDAGRTLRVTVTASNSAGTASASSSATSEILGVAPVNSELPTISGEAKEGALLTAGSGKWTGTEPIVYEYEWLRCNSSGVECTTAQAASVLALYSVGAADVGHTLRVNVLAKNIAGTGEAESEATSAAGGIAPENLLAPTVLGLPVTGQELTATEGTWKGTEPISYSFRWQRCSKAGGECTDISGAKSSKYKLVDEDATHTVRVLVTAKNVAGTVEKESSTTSEILGVGPTNTELPKVSGTTTAGQSLTATSGKWSGTEPILYEYEWLRCNTGGAECSRAAAASALGASYTLQPADVGHTMRARVIAKNLAGTGEAESAATATVAGVAPKSTVAPLVLGLDIVGQELSSSEGTWEGTAPISYSYRWQRCSKAGGECADISGAKSAKYKLVNEDAGHTVRSVVTASNVAGSTEKESAASGEVTGQVPSNTELPKVTGEAKEGQTLTATSGKWSGTEPILYEYEWLRCNSEGKACTQAAAKSALGASYAAKAEDVGKTLIAKVYAKNLAGTGEAESTATAPVAGVAPKNTIAPLTVPTVTTTSGSTVAVTEGTWEGTKPIAYEVEWKLCSSATICKVESKGEYATHKEFKVPAASGGKKLKVNVIATNTAGKGEKEALELSILI